MPQPLGLPEGRGQFRPFVGLLLIIVGVFFRESIGRFVASIVSKAKVVILLLFLRLIELAEEVIEVRHGYPTQDVLEI